MLKEHDQNHEKYMKKKCVLKQIWLKDSLGTTLRNTL